MPAQSKSQQRLFGMVHAYKKHELDMRGMSPGLTKKIKKIAGGIKDKSAKKFAKTKHKGLPNVKEGRNLTFKEYLVELTQQEKRALIAPLTIQKIYGELKKEHGFVERDVFLATLANRFNLTPDGLNRVARLPAIQVLPFGDGSVPGAQPKDPWTHIKQKSQNRLAEYNIGPPDDVGNVPLPDALEGLRRKMERTPEGQQADFRNYDGSLDTRYFGDWEGDDGSGDYDYQRLSKKTGQLVDSLVKDAEKLYRVKIYWDAHEKNHITFEVE